MTLFDFILLCGIQVKTMTERQDVTKGENSDMISIWISNRQCWRLMIAYVIVWSALMTRAEVSADSDVMDKLGMSPIEKDVMAPDFTVNTLSGDTIKLSSMKGKVVLLNFWATW
jgi:cytochrome oxidase Cu insertion factor (SCO1/SenC/PrrC family)